MTTDQNTQTEAEFLATYDPSKYPSIGFTVDNVIFTVHDGQLKVLLIERGEHPFRGQWALPGGFINPDEDADAAALRELQEETGVKDETLFLEQLRTYTTPNRDPRMRVISTSYVALVPQALAVNAGDDAANAAWFTVDDILNPADEEDRISVAFDHATIIADGVERVRSKLEYQPVATSLLGEQFTIADLRRIYEVVWGKKLHPANFRRKVLTTEGFVVPLGVRGDSVTGGNSASLYSRGDSTLLHPAILR